MPITHQSRTGKTYYLHTGPKRGGGKQHFFSTKDSGSMAESLPEGFEIQETVNGQVYLRRQQPKLILDEEAAAIQSHLPESHGRHRFKIETRAKTITVHECGNDWDDLRPLVAPLLTTQESDRIAEQFAHYQPVMRFTLVDADQRVFSPERYCFRGSVDDWISIGPPAPLKSLASRYLKHLGRESFYELY